MVGRKKYDMHKYWGKKPFYELKTIIEKFSEKGDVILDPFAGYGGFPIEGYILGRNVIANDLNPIANFITRCLISDSLNFEKFNEMVTTLNNILDSCDKYWNYIKIDEKNYKIVMTLRDENDIPIMIKVQEEGKRQFVEMELTKSQQNDLLKKEKDYELTSWYPKDELFINSRISAKKGMKICDLFPKRALVCHSKLLEAINSFEDSIEKDYLLMAFTANIANASKLVPPIRSRGKMSQGAWMTGFYIGKTYIENNVFHYYQNRINKIINGKKEYLLQIPKNKPWYQVTNQDAKRLLLEDESIDFIFTDFPYGDVVPYFEQSVIWNSWLGYQVDYENEIVISNSIERDKTAKNFFYDIEKAIIEIYRVLKYNKYFTFTYHSISGYEWIAITNALIKVGFKFHDIEWLVQKTYTPRQLNRLRSFKGDLIITLSKDRNGNVISLNEVETFKFVNNTIEQLFENKYLIDTNELIIGIVTKMFSHKNQYHYVDFIKIIENRCEINKEGLWRLKNV